MDDIQNNTIAIANTPESALLDAGVAHRLRGLAADITAFVSLQNSRLERVIGATFDNGDQLQEIDRRQAEIDTGKRELAQRQREAVEQVEDECDKLSAAWDQLEAQQRRLLAQGTGAAAPAPPPQVQPAMPGLPPTTILRSDIDLIADGAMPKAIPTRAQPWSSEPAAQQFQQMKREINRHARRRKQ